MSQTARRAATLDTGEQHRWMWLKLEQLLEKQHTAQKEKQAGAAPQNWPNREDQLREQLAEALKTQVGYFIMTDKS